jgi:hypothetical protein
MVGQKGHSVATMEAKNRPGLTYPNSAEWEVLRPISDGPPEGRRIELVVKGGRLIVPGVDVASALGVWYLLLGVTDIDGFWKRVLGAVRGRWNMLAGQLPARTPEDLPDGVYHVYLGDEDHPLQADDAKQIPGWDFSSPYGDHRPAESMPGTSSATPLPRVMFVNVRHVANLPVNQRVKDAALGLSEEFLHEMANQGRELDRMLTPQNASVLLSPDSDAFRPFFLATLTEDSPLVRELGEQLRRMAEESETHS